MPEDEDESADELFNGVEDVDDVPNDKSTEEVQNQWNPSGQQTPEWIPLALERLDDITNLLQTYQEERRQSVKRRYRHRETIVVLASVTLLLLIGGSAWMTVNGALSGDAFTFILGTLFGALLTFLQNILTQEQP